MPKRPPGAPVKGDRCRERKRDGRSGTVLKRDPDSEWVTVAWDQGGETICHAFELKVED